MGISLPHDIKAENGTTYGDIYTHQKKHFLQEMKRNNEKRPSYLKLAQNLKNRHGFQKNIFFKTI